MVYLRERYPKLTLFLDVISIVILGNLLWIVVSIPLVTIPLATVGLFGTILPLGRGEVPELLPSFLGTIRRHWLNAVILSIIIIFGFSLLTFYIGSDLFTNIPVLSVPLFIALIIGVPAICTSLYFFPLLVIFELPLRELLVMSFRLAMGHLPWTVLVGLLALLPLAFIMIFPPFLLVGAISTMVLVISWGTWHIMKRYTPV